MTLEEIQNWMKSHSVVDTELIEYDSSSNNYTSKIYTDTQGKFYRLEFMNNFPFQKYMAGKGYKHGDYCEPVEVVKKQRMEDYYEQV